MDRDPHDLPWHLLGDLDARKNPISWDREMDWIMERNFPTEHRTEMNSIFSRVIAITGEDRVVLRSLYFDVGMLDTKVHVYSEKKNQPVNYSYVAEFAKLTRHDFFINLTLHWRGYFAIKSIEQLSYALSSYIYGQYVDPGPHGEFDDPSDLDGHGAASINKDISIASEFAVLAETWPLTQDVQQYTDNEISDLVAKQIAAQNQIKAKKRHAPVKQVKEEFYNFYTNEQYSKYTDAARVFLKDLSTEKQEYFKAADGGVRTLTEFLRKRLKQDKLSN